MVGKPMGLDSSTFRMNIWLRALCKMILVLDYLPRYGRLFVLSDRIPVDGPIPPRKKTWSWQRRGMWGFYILMRMGLLFPYLKHLNASAVKA
jgi:hypothetical protein